MQNDLTIGNGLEMPDPIQIDWNWVADIVKEFCWNYDLAKIIYLNTKEDSRKQVAAILQELHNKKCNNDNKK